jgi:serine/threonine protein kinase
MSDEMDKIIDEQDYMFSIPNFCEIYKGRWAANGLICTVKEDYSDVKLLEDEKRWLEWISGKIKSHPNVVMYFCSYPRTQDGTIQGILTEFLPSTLRDFVHSKRTLRRAMPLDFKRSILVDVVLAMRYLHSQQIAHRNLNPYNIFLTRCLRAKVGNFYAHGRTQEHVGAVAKWQIKYDPGDKQESNQDFLPSDFEDETGETLDYFGFGCLMLFTFTYEWPTPIIKYTDEYERDECSRRKGIIEEMKDEILGKDYIPIMEQCLQDKASDRPNFKTLHKELTKAPLDPRFKQDSNYFQDILVDYGLDVKSCSSEERGDTASIVQSRGEVVHQATPAPNQSQDEQSGEIPDPTARNATVRAQHIPEDFGWHITPIKFLVAGVLAVIVSLIIKLCLQFLYG